jgi:outer membrane protein TolC
MIALNIYRRCLPVVLLTASASSFSLPAESTDAAGKDYSPLGGSETNSIVSHVDPIEIDSSLNLAKVIDLTLEKYPDTAWLEALEKEAQAISERSQSWTAGSSQATVGYETIYNLRLNYATAGVQVPLWNLGQRDAEQKLADEAEASAGRQASAVKLRVAGLVRSALWDMSLANIRHDQAKAELDIYEKLLSSIRRRVQSGDLPRTDELLAQTEMLQKRSSLTLVEAELMHARKRYSTVTQMTRVPRFFEEKLAPLKEIEQNHPALAALNSQIERKQAELNATRSIGSGQTQVMAGILSDEGNDPRSNKAEFFNVGISVPFGGSAHLAPQIAAINVGLNRLIADREQLYRDLEQAHHEAEHNLEVNRVELETANQQRKVSEELLKMTQLAFSVGEIDLMDLLRIQSRTQQAILAAKERAVMLQRDIALYNQAIGVLP